MGSRKRRETGSLVRTPEFHECSQAHVLAARSWALVPCFRLLPAPHASRRDL